jgi:hypothetical protein
MPESKKEKKKPKPDPFPFFIGAFAVLLMGSIAIIQLVEFGWVLNWIAIILMLVTVPILLWQGFRVRSKAKKSGKLGRKK